MAVKHYRDLNVHDAAKARLRLVFQHFERVCVAFSGGKDSSVTLHLALEVAREMKRGPVHAVFIDLEGQYQATIAHVTEMFDRPDVQPWWVCLPINLRNASSLREPYWCAWEPGREADWIRPLPSHPSVISDPARFPFYRHRMEFEEFVPEFNRWLARDASTAFLVGIRSDESLNRYLAVKRRTKKCAWTPPARTSRCPGAPATNPATAASPSFRSTTGNSKTCGATPASTATPTTASTTRCCGRAWRFRRCASASPTATTSARAWTCSTSSNPPPGSARSGASKAPTTRPAIAASAFSATAAAWACPTFSTWRQYCQFLLDSMPAALRQVYARRIDVFIQWWEQRGHPLSMWPDAGVPDLENRKAQPSWRRIGLSLLKQDMARSLSFGPARRDIDTLLPAKPRAVP